jgi:predicted transposase YbfD/YdcC
LEDVQGIVEQALDGAWGEEVVKEYTTREEGDGRVEERSYVIIDHVKGLRDQQAWAGVKTVGMCCRERAIGGETTTEVHYFIGSRTMSARRYAQALRNHWSIENNLHWQLDVSFGEDASPIADRQAATNFNVMRKMALCLIKRHPRKTSVARKRKAAALDAEFLGEIITGSANIAKV